MLASELAEARTFWQRFCGLMLRSGLPPGHGLYIAGCQSIHSGFMRFRFDAAFIDKQRQVVHVIHAMKPWRGTRVYWKAEGVVELPAGTLQATDTRPGDRLLLE